jgi:hypothetical protein
MGLLLNTSIAGILLLGILVVRRHGARFHNVVSESTQRHHEPTTKHWSADVFFSMDFIIRIHTDLQHHTRCHSRNGKTFQLKSLYGTPVINTIAPEYLRIIFGTGKDFGIQPMRLPSMEYFCGQGFLTMDGHTWLQSRKMLKPTFDKSNISDLGFLEREIDALITNIPEDGSSIDLEPMLSVAVSRSTNGMLHHKFMSIVSQ